MGIPDTSTTRRLSRVRARHRPLMTQVPSGFRTSGKRSSPDTLAIPGDATRRPKKADRFGSPPLAPQITKNARENAESWILCQEFWSPTDDWRLENQKRRRVNGCNFVDDYPVRPD